ncbi:hypothetical protein BD769DRAFT_1380719 [Suillus cothurnatus]|nr:hypothetical protein BD769DRAFT_1380719 [Suillus cothurnatus]
MLLPRSSSTVLDLDKTRRMYMNFCTNLILASSSLRTIMVYYVYIDDVNDSYYSRYVAVFANRAVADEWWLFFTLLLKSSGLSVIPILDFADHISGNLFFIRSRVSPNEYWHCPGSSTGNVTPNSKSMRRVSRSSHLIVSKSPEIGLKFSDLVNGFGVVTPLLENEDRCKNVKKLLKTDDGEEWELA